MNSTKNSLSVPAPNSFLPPNHSGLPNHSGQLNSSGTPNHPGGNLRNTPAKLPWLENFWLDALGVLAVLFLVAGEPLPAVNEPHYWTKAKHFWDSGFGQGDIFLESGNAHWLFYATFGLLTQCLPLPLAVWTGRWILWIALALGWTSMMHGFFRKPTDALAPFGSDPLSNNSARPTSETYTYPQSIPLIGTLSVMLWLAGMFWGHLAGEWVAGGAEAKVAAYALIFFSFGFFFRERWTIGWLYLGIACAFHVITGLWVFLGSLLICAVLEYQTSGSKQTWSAILRECWLKQGWGIMLATLGLIIGAIPPLVLDWGVPTGITTQAALIQVYGRLGHHLAPTQFSAVRWQAFSVLLAITVVLIALSIAANRSRNPSKNRKPNAEAGWPTGLKWLVGHGIFAFSVAAVACVIDWGGSGLSRDVVAKILKYYWFRWNDVAMPMAAMGAGLWLTTSLRSENLRRGAFFAMILIGGNLVWQKTTEHQSSWVGAGEKSRLLNKSDSIEEQTQELADWLAVCGFVREQTDASALWLTPRNQQTFKWHTGRGEVAAWKDMPQDAASVVEWSRRLVDAYPLDPERKLIPWSTEKIMELHQHYGFRYVLIDRRVRGQSPPLLPLLYPRSDEENATFSVFEIPNYDRVLSAFPSD